MSHEPVEVRCAERRDVAGLARMYRQEVELQREIAGRSFDLRSGYDWSAYAAGKLSARNRAVYVAESGSELVGFVEVRWQRRGRVAWSAVTFVTGWLRNRPRPSLHPPPNPPPHLASSQGVIEEVYVEPSWRRLGIGRRLAEAGLERLRETGASEILASIWEGNAASKALFFALGFHPSRVVVRLPLGQD